MLNRALEDREPNLAKQGVEGHLPQSSCQILAGLGEQKELKERKNNGTQISDEALSYTFMQRWMKVEPVVNMFE